MSYGTHADYGDVAKRQAMLDNSIAAASKGAAGGLAAAVPSAYLLHRNWGSFRHLSLPVKTFFVMSASIAAGVIAADKAGLKFEEEHYSDKGAEVRRKIMTEEEKEWAALSKSDRALTWAKDNKFSLVAGAWVTSLAGTFAIIQQQPFTFPQKLVQARVWAQGLTLASLVGMAAITQIPSAGDRILERKSHANDNSWRGFIDDQTGPGQYKLHTSHKHHSEASASQ